MQRRRQLWAAICLGMICFVVGLWSGCTVDDSFVETGEFACSSNEGCIEGYICEDGICVEDVVEPRLEEVCIDEDGDGYGTGENRTGCAPDKREKDCDDGDASIHPDAPEQCNGVDDDCDGAVDDFECTGNDNTVCGAPPGDLDDYLHFTCRNNTCTLVPSNQKTELQCDQMYITCNSAEQAFSYELDGETHPPEDVPDLCR